MNRRQPPTIPPGLFGGPENEDVLWAWAIPMLAVLAAVSTGGLWLAGEISYLTGGSPRPGSPCRYVESLIDGRALWPDVWGWTALALAVALVTTGGVLAFQLATKRSSHKHRVDRVARLLAPRADRLRLGPQARAHESAWLSPNDKAWTGSPIGRIVPSRQLACSGPEDVSIDVWGARAGTTTKRVIPGSWTPPVLCWQLPTSETCPTRRPSSA